MRSGSLEKASAKLCFVVPALDGPISGGTLYNRELCAALAESGCRLAVCALDEPRLAAELAAADYVFVDTLYLDALPELAKTTRGAPFLLTHYLPTLVSLGRVLTKYELSAAEARALRAAGGFLVTSDFMREALEPMVAPKQTICVVEPGSRAELAPSLEREPGAPLRALLIANLVPGKGVAPLLEALSAALRDNDRFELSVIGRLDADPEYAAHCAHLIARSTVLSARVTLQGAQSHERVLLALKESDLLLSASVMESFGMALGEARVSGVPVVARAGGYSAAHVERRAGGQLVTSAEELATVSLELARAPRALAERRERARRHARSARPWSVAAGELLAQLAGVENPEK